MSSRLKWILTALVVLLVVGGGILVWNSRPSSRASGDELVLGWMGPLTGDAAAYGRAIQNGSVLALEEAGQKLPGTSHRVRVLFEDDRAETALGRTVFKFLADRVTAPVIVQAAGSSVMLANIPEAQSRRIVYISPSCSSDRIRAGGDYIFRTWPSDDDQADYLADLVSKRLRAKTAAVLYIDNAYGAGLAEAFRQAFMKSGGTVPIFEPVQVGGTDFRAQLLRVKQAKPDIVFTPVQALEAARMMRQSRELQIESRFVADAVLYSQDFLASAGEAANGMLISNLAWNPGKSPEAADFARRYTARFGSEPDIYSAAGFDNMRLLLQALAASGNAKDGAAIRDALLRLPVFQGVTGSIKFNSDGEVSLPYELNEVRDGKFVVVGL